MTTKTERGIAIGIVISSATMTSAKGVPLIGVICEGGEESASMANLLQVAFGGKADRGEWSASGHECKRVVDEVRLYAPACKFVREMAQWVGRFNEYFESEPRKQNKKEEFGGWVNADGVKLF